MGHSIVTFVETVFRRTREKNAPWGRDKQTKKGQKKLEATKTKQRFVYKEARTRKKRNRNF